MSVNEESGSDVTTQHCSHVLQSAQPGSPAGFTTDPGWGKTGV